eukprot:scaffold94968_cov61-Attheya_sp.AAC.1
MGWVGGVNARVCDVIANRTSTSLAYCRSVAGCIVLSKIAVLCALWQFAANSANSNPTKMLVAKSTYCTSIGLLTNLKILIGGAKFA